jgi:large conductance mechanosensitive channel
MKNILIGFKQFILRGNVVDMAVGIVIGASFGSIVNALVKDIITPIIGAFGRIPSFNGLIFTINGSRFLYGDFLNNLISFLIVAATIYFFVVVPVNALIARSKKGDAPIDPTTKKCHECLSDIPVHAKRCAFCTTKIA